MKKSKGNSFNKAAAMTSGIFNEKRAKAVQGIILVGIVMYTILVALR